MLNQNKITRNVVEVAQILNNMGKEEKETRTHKDLSYIVRLCLSSHISRMHLDEKDAEFLGIL